MKYTTTSLLTSCSLVSHWYGSQWCALELSSFRERERERERVRVRQWHVHWLSCLPSTVISRLAAAGSVYHYMCSTVAMLTTAYLVQLLWWSCSASAPSSDTLSSVPVGTYPWRRRNGGLIQYTTEEILTLQENYIDFHLWMCVSVLARTKKPNGYLSPITIARSV